MIELQNSKFKSIYELSFLNSSYSHRIFMSIPSFEIHDYPNRALMSNESSLLSRIVQHDCRALIVNCTQKIKFRELQTKKVLRVDFTCNTKRPVWKMQGLMKTAQNWPHWNNSSVFWRKRLSESSITTLS